MSDTRRVCLLTGSSGVLGTAFCLRHASRYQIVAIWSRHPPIVASQEQYVVDPLDQERELIENKNRVFTVRADVTNSKATARVVDRVLARFGRIDLIIHAAGFRYWAPMLDGEAIIKSADRHFAVNIRAPLTLTVQVAQRFWTGRAAENASANRNVIAVSSTAGVHVYPGYGQSVYSASKAALNLLSQHMAAELSVLGVRANALAPDTFPGIIETDAVTDALVRLDQGNTTGRVLALEAAGETWL